MNRRLRGGARFDCLFWGLRVGFAFEKAIVIAIQVGLRSKAESAVLGV
jgi:hypothetical protein